MAGIYSIVFLWGCFGIPTDQKRPIHLFPSPPVKAYFGFALDCFASSISRASRSMSFLSHSSWPIGCKRFSPCPCATGRPKCVGLGTTEGREKRRQRGMPFPLRRNTLGVSPTRWVPVAHDNGESDARGLQEHNLVLEEGVQIVRTYLWLPVDDVVADILQAGHRAEGADDDDEGRGGLVRHRDAILRALQTLPHTPGCSLIWFQKNLQNNVSHEMPSNSVEPATEGSGRGSTDSGTQA